MSVETAVLVGAVVGAVIAATGCSLIDRRFRRVERRLIDQLLAKLGGTYATLAEGCRVLVDLYAEAQPGMPHRFGELELRKKLLADAAASFEAHAALLQEAARRPVSHARARKLLAQIEAADDRIEGWEIG